MLLTSEALGQLLTLTRQSNYHGNLCNIENELRRFYGGPKNRVSWIIGWVEKTEFFFRKYFIAEKLPIVIRRKTA